MKASDANSIANGVILKSSTLADVFSEIKKSAESGKFSITFNNILTDEEKNCLEVMGYIVRNSIRPNPTKEQIEMGDFYDNATLTIIY